MGSNDARGIGGSGAEAYCNELQKSCFRQCWNRKPVITSIPKHSGKHNEYCSELCLQEFMKCVKEQEELERQESRKEMRFSDMEVALDWLRRHKSEVALGTVVVVAGVAFAIVIAAGGALLLAPLCPPWALV